MVIAGAVVGGVSYAPFALVAVKAWAETDAPTHVLVIPVLGPWISLATYERCTPDTEWCFDPTSFAAHGLGLTVGGEL